jgi:hypothetical protein
MAFSKQNPAARAGADRARDCIAVAANCLPEIAENIAELHKIRVAHLARRYRLAPISAGVVAGLHFGEGAR